MNRFKRIVSLLLFCTGILFFIMGYYQTHSSRYSTFQDSYFTFWDAYRHSDKTSSIRDTYKNAMQLAQHNMRELEEKQKQDYMIGAFSAALGLVVFVIPEQKNN